MSKKLLISVDSSEECRVAVLKNGKLDGLFVERSNGQTSVGNIYKAKVLNVEPSIQAAFLDLGRSRNGFLHVSDIMSQALPKKQRGKKNSGIQHMIQKGQDLMVQVTRDSIYEKGPALTTNVSIPGRYLVLMPYLNRKGVSRKIEDDAQRRKLKDMLGNIDTPKDMGVIARTAGANQTLRNLRRDVEYLKKLWKTIDRRFKQDKAPCSLYLESDLLIRTIRDVFTTDTKEIVIDNADAVKRAKDFMKNTMPRYRRRVRLFDGKDSMFYHFQVESMIEEIFSRKVPIPGGGSVIIEETEALIAIDVNSGKFTKGVDAEQTAFRTNMAAAELIARQLRLRDLGGQIVIDFIDMTDNKLNRKLERAFRDALKEDRAKTSLARISKFGILEMTRQRLRTAIHKITHEPCARCKGTGMVKTPETLALEVIRALRHKLVSRKQKDQTVTLRVSPEVIPVLVNNHRRDIQAVEDSSKITVRVLPDSNLNYADFTLDFS